MLPSVVPRLSTDSAVRVFPGVWKLLKTFSFKDSLSGTDLRPVKGVLKREKFPNTRKHSHCRVCAEPWKHRGQHNREEK